MSTASEILQNIKNNKKIQTTENIVNYLQRVNKNLNTNNILTLAYLANNPAITEEERNIFLECLREKSKQEYELYKGSMTPLEPPLDKGC